LDFFIPWITVKRAYQNIILSYLSKGTFFFPGNLVSWITLTNPSIFLVSFVLKLQSEFSNLLLEEKSSVITILILKTTQNSLDPVRLNFAAP